MMSMVLVDILRGLMALYENGWTHRSIKHETISEATGDAECMATGTCTFVIGDLGSARRLQDICSALDFETWRSMDSCYQAFGRIDAGTLATTLQLMFMGQEPVEGTLQGTALPSVKKTNDVRQNFISKDIYKDVSAKVQVAQLGLKLLLSDMTSSPEVVTGDGAPKLSGALARAEKIYFDLYGKTKPLDSALPRIPRCLEWCAQECPAGSFCQWKEQQWSNDADLPCRNWATLGLWEKL